MIHTGRTLSHLFDKEIVTGTLRYF